MKEKFTKKWNDFYAVHSHFYDQTRWLYLFGRNNICDWLPKDPPGPIIEIGCGTGFNLTSLAARFPDKEIIGVDATIPMLDKARKRIARNGYAGRISLQQCFYGKDLIHCLDNNGTNVKPGVLFFSYALTLMPDYEHVIEQAYKDLCPKGYIAVVDFVETKFKLVHDWFKWHQVQMNEDIIHKLEKRFPDYNLKTSLVFGGLWKYCIFVGKKAE